MKKKTLQIALAASLFLAGCGDYNKILKSTDYEYRYEAAKEYFMRGQYNKSTTLLNA